jgi:diguanylate cyclase (GGDEF)-like protein
MSAQPGQPGGPPAGAFEGSDVGAPPAERSDPDDNTPAVEPGQPTVTVPNPAQPAEVQHAPRASAAPSVAYGQASPTHSSALTPAQMWDPWKGPDQKAWYADVVRSPYTVLEGLGSGAAKGEAVFAGLLHADVSPDEAEATSAGVDPEAFKRAAAEAQQNAQAGADKVTQDARERVAALTPDPQTTGVATQIIHGVTESGELAITGTLAGGLPGAVTALGSAEGLSRYQDLRDAGVDERTALESAGLTGTLAGAGALLPGGFGSTLTAKLLTGVGANVTLGGISRYSDHQILESGGYHEMAEQQQVWDSTQILTDAILGAGFGGLAHLHAPQAEDAARTVNGNLNARRTAPGVPVDPAAAAAHAASLNKASEDLLAGRPVDVSAQPRGDYLERPTLEDPELAQAFVDSLHESGLVGEERKLEDLNAQLAEYLSSEPVGPATLDRLANDEGLRAGLTAMKDETGQAEQGGRTLMNEAGEVTGRTPWVAKSEWWNDRPAGMSEREVHAAVDRALAGKQLGSRQAKLIRLMTDVHDERASGGRRAVGRQEGDRRTDQPQRRKVADMGPEELRAALLQHELTGLPNRRAYAESEKLPAQVSIDVDSLKWINDNLGHEAGDRLLKSVGEALSEHPNTFHVSGDEFLMQAHTPEAAHEVMAKVAERLAGHELEFVQPDGSVRRVKGLGVSYGVGENLHEAEERLQEHKSAREKAGTRAARGEKPPGADEGNRGLGRQAQANPDTGAGRGRAAGERQPAGGSESGSDSGRAVPVEQIVAENPHLQIPASESQSAPTENARDALNQVNEQTSQTEKEAPAATEAAVNCFMRKGP